MIAMSFWFFFFVASSTTFMAGRRVERIFVSLLIFGVIATYVLNANLGWINARLLIFLIDASFLSLALFLSSRADCYWPIWFAGFLAIAVATSLSETLFPNKLPAIYIAIQGFWFLPAMASMAIGTVMDGRLRTSTT
jgi:hypothetical protein